MKQILILLSVGIPIFAFNQSFNVGIIAAYQKSNLKRPAITFFDYEVSSEINFGINSIYKFKNKFSLNVSFIYNLTNFFAETANVMPPFTDLVDPEKDIKHNLNYLNPNIKLHYYKNDIRDGITVGFGTYIYLSQRGNYDSVLTFSNYSKFYNVLSFGYYIYPIKNFMTEIEFVGNITAFGDSGISEPEWRQKYWKYGLRFSVTYNFLSLPKNKAE